MSIARVAVYSTHSQVPRLHTTVSLPPSSITHYCHHHSLILSSSSRPLGITNPPAGMSSYFHLQFLSLRLQLLTGGLPWWFNFSTSQWPWRFNVFHYLWDFGFPTDGYVPQRLPPQIFSTLSYFGFSTSGFVPRRFPPQFFINPYLSSSMHSPSPSFPILLSTFHISCPTPLFFNLCPLFIFLSLFIFINSSSTSTCHLRQHISNFNLINTYPYPSPSTLLPLQPLFLASNLFVNHQHLINLIPINSSHALNVTPSHSSQQVHHHLPHLIPSVCHPSLIFWILFFFKTKFFSFFLFHVVYYYSSLSLINLFIQFYHIAQMQ